MLNVLIRKAKKTDLDAIVELSGLMMDYHHQLDPEYWNTGRLSKPSFRKYLTKQMAKRSFLVLVVENREKMVGYFSAEIIKTKPNLKPKQIGYLRHGFLLPKYRSQGIARKAGEILVVWFKKNGVRMLELSVDSRNKVGIRAWEGLGFREFKKEMKLEI